MWCTKTKYIILVFLFLTLGTPSFFFLTPVGAIELTSTPFWFFIYEPTDIDFPEMVFRVRNSDDQPVEAVCSYKPIEGIDLDVQFTWTNITIAAGGIVENHYSIHVNSSFTVTIRLEIYVRKRPANQPGSQLSAGGIIHNHLSFYSEEDGALLNINVVDQSNTPRNSTVNILYKYNTSMSWTPIHNFVGTHFEGVFPLGEYLIQARDVKVPNIFTEEHFIITNSSVITLKLELVGFQMFLPIGRGEVNETNHIVKLTQAGVNTTINNWVGIIDRVEVFAELYHIDADGDETLLDATEPFVISPFYPTFNRTQSLVMWFDPMKHPAGNYRIVGKIQTYGLLIAHTEEGFPYYPPPTQFNIFNALRDLFFPTVAVVALALYIREKRK